mmetsp:Transcript_11701/g.36087  ORF Transcript_11701/g.36087 Transcript_11701/m.36087 type:complete len:202 (-) Transcript_11701:27-632(-)
MRARGQLHRDDQRAPGGDRPARRVLGASDGVAELPRAPLRGGAAAGDARGPRGPKAAAREGPPALRLPREAKDGQRDPPGALRRVERGHGRARRRFVESALDRRRGRRRLRHALVLGGAVAGRAIATPEPGDGAGLGVLRAVGPVDARRPRRGAEKAAARRARRIVPRRGPLPSRRGAGAGESVRARVSRAAARLTSGFRV